MRRLVLYGSFLQQSIRSTDRRTVGSTAKEKQPRQLVGFFLILNQQMIVAGRINFIKVTHSQQTEDRVDSTQLLELFPSSVN
jgi:hypothetical protein